MLYIAVGCWYCSNNVVGDLSEEVFLLAFISVSICLHVSSVDNDYAIHFCIVYTESQKRPFLFNCSS